MAPCSRRSRCTLPFCVSAAFAFWTSSANAQSLPDGLYAATFAEHPHANTVEVTYGSSTAHARIGRRLRTPDARSLYSTDNANDAYTFDATFRGRRCSENAVLLVSGHPMPIGSVGRDSRGCTYSFPVTRAQADQIASAFAIPREDRTPVGEQVTAAFSVSAPSIHRGDSLEVRITFRNPSSAPAVQREGGCCRFSFVIYRDGVRLPDLQCMATACPVGYGPLAPGATAQDTVDLGRWGNFQTAGHYRVECRYKTRFAREGIPTFDAPSFTARMWERVFTGVVEFVMN